MLLFLLGRIRTEYKQRGIQKARCSGCGWSYTATLWFVLYTYVDNKHVRSIGTQKHNVACRVVLKRSVERQKPSKARSLQGSSIMTV